MHEARRLAAGLASGVLALASVGCNAGPEKPAAPAAGANVRVTGRLLDARIGKPVARTRLWIHGFNDEVKAQASLKPEEGSTAFELFLPTPHVRLRIADKSDEYVLFEQSYEASDGRLDIDVRLQPSDWIVLRGRILWDDEATLRPFERDAPKVGDARFYFGRSGSLQIDNDTGTYSARLPRELAVIRAVNTSFTLHPKSIDLTGATEAERVVDLTFRDD
jgi:hypothetical protein